jgi:hypothetical protein
LDISAFWTASATSTSAVRGQNSLSSKFEGSLVFAVFLSRVTGTQGSQAQVVPENSVVGRMRGKFEAQVSTQERRVTGGGTAEWTVAGRYDPATETIIVAIRSSGLDARGTDAVLGDGGEGAGPAAVPFSMALNWGWQAPRARWGQISWAADPAAILDAMEATPRIPPERAAELCLVNSIPQTGVEESQRLVIDLKEPGPQTVTRTSEDATGLGSRTTTWSVALVPSFDIERDDRIGDGCNSFVSTDAIGLRVSIHGVTVAGSGWANLASWKVEGVGQLSGSGVPSELQHSATFGFHPGPSMRPTDGSTRRNRPLQYTVKATFEGAARYFILSQDDVDILRQEYIDHREPTVPARPDIVARPIDGSFNEGNYNFVVDGGMQAALEKIAVEFGKGSKSVVHVVGGFRSPQRNKATGDVHPGNKHVLGRALDLAPEPASAEALLSLYQACIRAGYRSFCEETPGKRVPSDSPDARHVHADW